MPNDRDRWDRGPDRSRGMFGYEGEGYLREGDDRERNWRRLGGMPDRVDPGRPLERYSGRDRVHERDEWEDGESRSTPQRSEWRSFRGVGPRGYRRSDERLHEEVCERLAWHHEIDASDIDVAVADGTVTLTGTVSDRRTKRLAEDVADSVGGVHDVQNHLAVRRDRHPAEDHEALQSGLIGLASSEHMDSEPARGIRTSPGTARSVRASLGGGEGLRTPGADRGPMTNPGAPSTGTRPTTNSGIVSGHTTAGERARRKR